MKSGDPSNSASLTLLAIAAGSSDVIAFLLLGHVFASAMTGNTALLGIALSDGDLIAVTQPFSALFGFAAGVGLATVFCNAQSASPRQKPIVRHLLVLEAACLALFAIIWELGQHSAGEPTHYVLILLCSVAMGIQGVVARRFDAPGVNVCRWHFPKKQRRAWRQQLRLCTALSTLSRHGRAPTRPPIPFPIGKRRRNRSA